MRIMDRTLEYKDFVSLTNEIKECREKLPDSPNKDAMPVLKRMNRCLVVIEKSLDDRE